MTIDERIEFLLKVQESHEANLNRVFELQAQTEQALGRFILRTDETLNTMARILELHENRLTDLEGGAQ
jgi:hypothetical protein